MERKWYVLQTKPRNELIVSKQIGLKKIEYFLPMIEKVRIWADRKRKIQIPMFSGYVFVYATEEERVNAISETTGAVKYIFFEKRPAVVSKREIEIIKSAIAEPEKIRIEDKKFKKGDEIIVTNGVFRGMKGFINEFRGNYKLTVNLEELAFSFSIILNSSEVSLL
ncbi:MAG TPA: UpxY family transcription antiterminator [Ignavibacteria bacterium]|nr:UpxY family transcription antiterminator [Ignavibacteria bacterium]